MTGLRQGDRMSVSKLAIAMPIQGAPASIQRDWACRASNKAEEPSARRRAEEQLRRGNPTNGFDGRDT